MLAARLGCLLFAVTAALVASAAANASETIDSNATGVALAGQREGRGARHVLGGREAEAAARLGADGANPPVRGGKQVALLDYSGGYGKYHTTFALYARVSSAARSAAISWNSLPRCWTLSGW